MKKVLVTGTFDIFHKGHEFFLRESRKRGDYLIVIVATDKTLAALGKTHVNNERFRLARIQRLSYVDETVLGNEGEDKLALILEEKPAVICLGYDQSSFTENLKERLLKRGLRVSIMRLPAYKPDRYKSSKLRKHHSC
jgi:FAD synthetase